MSASVSASGATTSPARAASSASATAPPCVSRTAARPTVTALRLPLLAYVADEVAVAEAEHRVLRVLGLLGRHPLPVDLDVVGPVDGHAAARGEGGQEQDRFVGHEDVGLGEHVPAQRRVAAEHHLHLLAQPLRRDADLLADPGAERDGGRLVDRARVGLQVDRVHLGKGGRQPVGVPAQQHAHAGGGLGPGRVVVEHDGLHQRSSRGRSGRSRLTPFAGSAA